MTIVTLDQLRDRIHLMGKRWDDYGRRAKANGGKLPLSDVWRHEYAADPYLIGCNDDRLATRFRDIFINQTELGKNGLIGLLPVDAEIGFQRKFTHLLEEYSVRGGLPTLDPDKQMPDYFANSGPIAARIFAGYEEPAQSFLVKYGERQFLEPMLRDGIVRVCPGSYYGHATHNNAVRDDEVSRAFYISTYLARLKGDTYTEVRGHRLPFNDDDIELPVVFPDYYFFSVCDAIYYRMPTDFGADAALVIRDPARFTQRVVSAFLAKMPDWEPMRGPVTYYDPYLDRKKFRVPEMAKPFGYAYQREVRIAFRSQRRPPAPLAPVFLDIGAMDDYAELLWA